MAKKVQIRKKCVLLFMLKYICKQVSFISREILMGYLTVYIKLLILVAINVDLFQEQKYIDTFLLWVCLKCNILR